MGKRKKMKGLFLIILLITCFHAMEANGFERWLTRWAHKVLHNLKDQTKPGELTPEGLAYILLTFPPDMLYEIERHIEIPNHLLIQYISQQIQPKKMITEWYPVKRGYGISCVRWFPMSKILQAILTSDSLIGRKYLTYRFSHSNYTTDGLVLLEPNPTDADYQIALHLPIMHDSPEV